MKRTSGNETEQTYFLYQSKKSSNFKFLRYTMSLSRICVSSWGNRICSVIRVWKCKIRTFRSHTFAKNKKNFSFAFVFDDLIFDAICVSHGKSKSFYYPLTKIRTLILINWFSFWLTYTNFVWSRFLKIQRIQKRIFEWQEKDLFFSILRVATKWTDNAVLTTLLLWLSSIWPYLANQLSFYVTLTSILYS